MGSALGALKVAASRARMTLDDYQRRVDAGEKRCWSCGEWKPRAVFPVDATRGDGLAPLCAECRSARQRERYEPVAPDQRKPMGPPRAPRRDGDKIQARARVNADIRLGLRPDPNDLHCARCGHKGEDRRHEYHHVMGYTAEHHYDVLPLCSTCHHEEH